MNYPKYSVLTPVYQKENALYLKRCIESIVAQTVQTDDFVIVKDGPLTDELEHVLAEMQAKYNFIHVYSYSENRGAGYARNFGLKKTKNEIVALMDSDDISLPYRCQRQLDEFISNPALDIVGTSIYEFNDSEENIVSKKVMPETITEIKKYARRRIPFNNPTIMVKKTSVFQHGGYKEGQRGEDFALLTKMVFEGCQAKNINEKLYLYRANDNQYKRRSSFTDAKAVLSVAKDNLHNRYISMNDFLFIVIAQLAGLIIPANIGSFIFKRMFRERIRD